MTIESITSPQTSSTKILKGPSTLNTHSAPLPEGSKCCLVLYWQGRSTSHSTDIWTRSIMLQSLQKNYFLFFIHLFATFHYRQLHKSTRLEKPKKPAYYLLFSRCITTSCDITQTDKPSNLASRHLTTK